MLKCVKCGFVGRPVLFMDIGVCPKCEGRMVFARNSFGGFNYENK